MCLNVHTTVPQTILLMNQPFLCEHCAVLQVVWQLPYHWYYTSWWVKEENNRQVFFYEVISFWWQSLVSVDKLDHVILTARKPLYHSSIHVVCIYWPKSFPHQDSEDHYVVGRFINNKGWNYKKKCNEQMYWINCYKLANKKCNIDFSNFDSFIDMFVYLQNGNIHAF